MPHGAAATFEDPAASAAKYRFAKTMSSRARKSGSWNVSVATARPTPTVTRR